MRKGAWELRCRIRYVFAERPASCHFIRPPEPDLTPARECTLSVVVGSVDSVRTIDRCLEALDHACHGLAAEIIVVDASRDGTGERVRQRRVPVELRRMPAGTLTPVLWSSGLAAARGRVVAFTTGHCIVSETWARALLAGIDAGATGVAGALSLDAQTSPTDWALFYLRYSAFLVEATATVRAVAEIPGDNAAYRHDVLDRHGDSFRRGFWEVDFHRRIRADDPSTILAFVRGAEARLGATASIITLSRHRFSHGRHSGSWRVETGVRSAAQVVAMAPFVPLILLVRTGRRVVAQPQHRKKFLRAMPILLILATAWALGEARGALDHARGTGGRQQERHA